MSQDEAVEILEPAVVIPAMPRDDESTAPANERALVLEDLLTHRENVFKICLGFSRNYAEAEDLAQDAYVRAFQGWKDLRNPAQSKEWLFRIAKNICLDRQKKDRRRVARFRRWAQEIKKEEQPRLPYPDDDRMARLKSAVAALPKTLRAVFVLREYGHLPYDEIAATMRIRRGTVMSRLNRGRKRVAKFIEEKKP